MDLDSASKIANIASVFLMIIIICLIVMNTYDLKIIRKDNEDFNKYRTCTIYNWKNKKGQMNPVDYYNSVLVHKLGPAHHCERNAMIWYNPQKLPNVTRVVLKDESISHDFPTQHNDFIYSTANIHLTKDQQCALAYISGSIIIDRLAGTVTVRCGKIIKNQVTLGFVDDLSKGIISGSYDNLKSIYAQRISNNITTASFSNTLNE
jgi:hypothetical protein